MAPLLGVAVANEKTLPRRVVRVGDLVTLRALFVV